MSFREIKLPIRWEMEGEVVDFYDSTGRRLYAAEIGMALNNITLRPDLALQGLESVRSEGDDPVIRATLVGPDERFEIALNVKHPKCHAAADAFWAYWKENGETHKHGYYESTWGAINAALRLVGVRTHNYSASALSPARVAEGRSANPEFEHEPPDTQGTWQERCSALYQVIGCMAHMFNIFETSDDISDALDVAAGRGDVETLLPWPKTDLRKLAEREPATDAVLRLLRQAQEDLIWCGGSADFGPGGQAKIGYDKGPRATIAAIGAALKGKGASQGDAVPVEPQGEDK